MATAIVDTLSTLEYDEDEHGPLRLTRSFHVKGLTDGDIGLLETALGTSGIPAANSSPSDYPELYAVSRKARVVDKQRCEVIVQYERRSKTIGNFVFSGGASLTQTTRTEDRFNNPVFVTHTFLASDEDFPLQSKTQRQTIESLMPVPSLRAVGEIETDVPLTIRSQWIGYVNSEIWANDAERTWLVTSVDFEEIDTNSTPAKWLFTFEFQKSNDSFGWDPRAVFWDERSRFLPTNQVQAGLGIKRVEVYPGRDFNELFPI